MTVSPYILLRESDRREILGRVEERVYNWTSSWLQGDVPAFAETLSVINNSKDFYKVVITLRDYRVADAGSGRIVYLKVQSNRRFANLLLGGAGNDAAALLTDVEKGLVDTALDELAVQLLSADGLAVQDFQSRDADGGLLELVGPGAGAGYCELGIAGISLSVLLSPEGLRSIWSRPAAASPEGATTQVREALGGLNATKVKVRAQLPSADMTIGDLASMNIGDVVRLSARVDEHIAVQVGDSPRALRANLGSVSGSRAFQVVGVASQQQND